MFDVSNVKFRSETKVIVLKEALNTSTISHYHTTSEQNQFLLGLLVFFGGV